MPYVFCILLKIAYERVLPKLLIEYTLRRVYAAVIVAIVNVSLSSIHYYGLKDFNDLDYENTEYIVTSYLGKIGFLFWNIQPQISLRILLCRRFHPCHANQFTAGYLYCIF